MAKKVLMVGAVAAVALGAPAVARADKFEQLAEKAVSLDGPGGLAALFWTATVDCSKAGDDLAQRQCEGVRAARAGKTAGKTFLIDGEAGAFWAGEWDEEKKGMPIGVRGCVACADAVDIGGERRFLVTKGDVAVKGGALIGPEIHKALRMFPDEAAAKKWRDVAVPRLRTQFLIKVPEKPAGWTEGGAKGFAVELLAFRVYDPCDGAMICSNPPSAQEKADQTMCKGGDATGTDIQETKPDPEEVKPVEPVLPDKLSASDVKRAMQKAGAEVNACYATYGVPGKADLNIEIGGDGVVKKVALKGEFEDTPTGQCIIDAVKQTVFPKFKAASMTVKYPFILR